MACFWQLLGELNRQTSAFSQQNSVDDVWFDLHWLILFIFDF
jgi:hypothetical protein